MASDASEQGAPAAGSTVTAVTAVPAEDGEAGHGRYTPPRFRLAATSDLHCRGIDQVVRLKELFRAVNDGAQGLVMCGDLTDHGLIDEAKALADALTELKVPCAAVLGNHDLENGAAHEICQILKAAGVHVLDGDHVEFTDDLGVAGVKGFCGGFGSATLQAFGEASIKAFVQEAVSEELKLEAALAQLDTARKVVIMHYAPVPDTTVGENLEIRAYLGSSRLATPVDMHGADVVFHGHAHHGTLEGRTAKGVPVYNVAFPLLRKSVGQGFFVVDL
ncbi:metallophosphoesterase family protein [Chondromyces apiculatus]|uniref:Metallophosphoesterase n=1 Tax=Chondromyces apiculatus DSM 436 TaxID=1192034 RepID=A0A017SWH0_9BACT|nr:metallophosphoesterase [Chondromyces apiculatus]EYF00955.1 Metallophosphoesterase [Chondromyces apiculatus DSM 436]